MTQDSLKRGQELVRIIQEAQDFLKILNKVVAGDAGTATLTLTASTGISNPSLVLTRYPEVAAALAKELQEEVKKLEIEFQKL